MCFLSVKYKKGILNNFRNMVDNIGIYNQKVNNY